MKGLAPVFGVDPSLGVQQEKIEQVFAKRKGAKVAPFTPKKNEFCA